MPFYNKIKTIYHFGHMSFGLVSVDLSAFSPTTLRCISDNFFYNSWISINF